MRRSPLSCTSTCLGKLYFPRRFCWPMVGVVVGAAESIVRLMKAADAREGWGGAEHDRANSAREQAVPAKR